MKTKIDTAIGELQASLETFGMDSIANAKSVLQRLAVEPELRNYLKKYLENSAQGAELYRDKATGFVLLAYTETQGTYRIPHNHGEAWVIYSVCLGNVEMGNYFRAVILNREPRLILKDLQVLTDGDTRVYYPGEIHDTRCISESAIILRLTSSDLKEEERQGRMQRFQT